MGTLLPGRLKTGGGVSPFARGFTLFEVVLVMIIIGIMSSMLIPVFAFPFRRDHRTDTQKEMSAIVDAIYGRSDLGDFGYLGTMGELPPMVTVSSGTALSVDALFVQPAGADNPNSSGLTLNAGGVPAGWNGPYLRSSSPDPRLDAWGKPYEFDFNSTDTTRWRIRSNGPDFVAGTGDDIVLPSANSWFTSAGELQIELFLSRLNRRMERLPDDYLAPVTGPGENQRTAISVKTYLPISGAASRLECASESPDSQCPGICEVVDANGSTSAFAAGNAASPFRISCRGLNSIAGLPYGVHRMVVGFDAGHSPALSSSFETNIVVTRPHALVRVVVPGDADSEIKEPILWKKETLSTTSSAGTTLLSAESNIPTGTPISTTSPLSLALRFSGTLKVKDTTTECTLELKSTGGAVIFPDTPPKIHLKAWDGITEEAELPFSYRYLLHLESGTVPDLSTLKLVLARSAGSEPCDVIDPTLKASSLRHVQR